MSFTNQMLGALGSATGAIAASKHIKNQNKELEIKKVEAEQEAFNAANALKSNTESIAQEMLVTGNEGLNDIKPGPDAAEQESEAVDKYLEDKSNAAEDKYQEVMSEVKHPETSKRVQAARDAANNLQDEINARRNLKFNLEIANKKLNSLRGVK